MTTIILLLIVLILIIAALGVVFGQLKGKGQLTRALNLSLFLISLPREVRKEGEQLKPEKEIIGIMEQLYSSLSNIHSKGRNKLLYGEPYIVLEMAVHHIGEEIHFYAAVPRGYEATFEKQIHGFYPTASVEKTNDYNIFDPEGTVAASYLTLQNDAILPFKTYKSLEADPLGEIATAMSKLEGEGEGALIQVVIRPAHNEPKKSFALKVVKDMQSGLPFKDAFSKAQKQSGGISKELGKMLSSPKKEEGGKPEERQPQVVTPYEEELLKSIQNKASKINFDTNIRLIASAMNPQRAENILKELEGAFVQFVYPDANQFKMTRIKAKKLERFIFNASWRFFNEKQKTVLSTEELSSIYHFPLGTTLAPKIKFLKAKQAEPPPNLPKEGVTLGISNFRGTKADIKMSQEDRRRHLYIIGQTGTGKSSLMKEMVRQDIEAGNGTCVIDPHGEFAEHVLSIVPKERAEDVIYFNPGDIERPLGLNMLEIDPSHPEQKTAVINELLSIIDKLYNLKETGGPMFEKYFKNSLLLLLDDYQNEIPTLADISRVLVNDKFRADKLSRETDPLVKEFWQLEAEKAGGEASLANMAPYISSKIDTFVSNEYLRPIINQARSAFNFREIIDNQKILIVNLSKGRIGDINANLLGMVIVGKLLMASLSRVDIPESERKDFYLYIDEFQNFTTESIAIILSEARKYRLDLVIAHQFIKQLKEEIRNAVFGNVGSMVAFRVGADDAEFLKNQFDPVFTQQDLMNIDNFNAYVKLLINNQTTRPFNVQTIKEKEGLIESADAIKEMSRLKYGRPKQEIEQELMAKYK